MLDVNTLQHCISYLPKIKEILSLRLVDKHFNEVIITMPHYWKEKLLKLLPITKINYFINEYYYYFSNQRVYFAMFLDCFNLTSFTKYFYCIGYIFNLRVFRWSLNHHIDTQMYGRKQEYFETYGCFVKKRRAKYHCKKASYEIYKKEFDSDTQVESQFCKMIKIRFTKLTDIPMKGDKKSFKIKVNFKTDKYYFHQEPAQIRY
ncbi:hypothetical protein ABK040_013434 [Willaertia magna]